MIAQEFQQHQLDTSYIKAYLHQIRDLTKDTSINQLVESIEVLTIHLEEILGNIAQEVEHMAKTYQRSSKQFKDLDLGE